MAVRETVYKRVLIKLSGEALLGNEPHGIDAQVLERLGAELSELHKHDVQIAIVIGGGNIFRGAKLAEAGMERVTGDHMGMLRHGHECPSPAGRSGAPRALRSCYVSDPNQRNLRRLPSTTRYSSPGERSNRRVCGGTGNPFFTTDSAASLRAIEIEADLMIKATKVDGVYSDDPVKNPDAERYTHLDYDEVLERKLNVMDATAVVLCRDHGMRMRVLDMGQKGALLSAVCGDDTGTLVERKGN